MSSLAPTSSMSAASISDCIPSFQSTIWKLSAVAFKATQVRRIRGDAHFHSCCVDKSKRPLRLRYGLFACQMLQHPTIDWILKWPIQDAFLSLKAPVSAGLGDKILAVLVAAMYARLTERQLYVDWRDHSYGDGTRNYFWDLFQFVGLPLAEVLPTSDGVYPAAWQGRLPLSLDDIVTSDGFSWNRDGGRTRYSFDQTRLNYDEDVLVMWEMDQFPKVRALYEARFGGWQELTDMQTQAKIFQKHFVVNANVQSRIDTFVTERFATRPVIGVHVRMTDESEACRRNPTLSAFLRAASKVLRISNAASIFLASDNRTVIDRFQSEFGAARILTIDKWLPQAGMRLFNNHDCPDLLQGARDALVDAGLLGRCDWLIASHESSFSRLATMFSTAPLERQFLLFPHVPLAARLRSAVRQCPFTTVVDRLRPYAIATIIGFRPVPDPDN